MKYQIITASSREIVWEGEAINPRHARKQAATILGRSHIGLPGYITVQENIPEYANNQTYFYNNDPQKY